ncbi:hypothetical protein [Rhodococcoides fascians]|uniref:hypothetical protein n=1 Tax=Rhodococcoides fascians TaxID=1828 RepID=UPI0012D33DAF|nr:hypothetical protein [Rhodococcus fascians]
MHNTTPTLAGILSMVIVALIAVIVGICTGALAKSTGAPWAVAIRQGTVAVAGSLTLGILIMTTMGIV